MENPFVRSDPELAQAIVENLANDVAGQTALGRVARELTIPESHQAAAKGPDPDRAVGFRQQRTDRGVVEAILRSMRGALSVVKVVERAVARSNPDSSLPI